MPAPSFPLINGNRYDYTSIEIMVEGIPYRGIKSIDYEDSLDSAKQYGTSARPLGRTRGKYDASGSLEIFLEDAVVLRTILAAVGNGGMGAANFTIVVAYAEIGSPIVVVKMLGCRVKKVAASHAQGNDGITEKWDLDVMDITRNGVSLLSGIDYVK